MRASASHQPESPTYSRALLTRSRLDDTSRTAVGALYDSTGDLVPSSVRSVDRADQWRTSDPPSLARIPDVIGRYAVDGADMFLDRAVLGGHVFGGWGHTLAETLSTAWAADVDPDAPLVMVPWGRVWMSTIARTRTLLGLAGWKGRPILVTTASVLFDRVTVPPRLVRLDDLLHAGEEIDHRMNCVYDRIAGAARSGSSTVFLARPPGHRRRHPNEDEVMRLLEAQGHAVVSGWELEVEDQVAAVASAGALVGFSGSNLHNSVFGRYGLPVIEIADHRRQHDREHPSWLQDKLCRLRDQRHSVVPGYDASSPRRADLIMRDVLARL